MAVKFETVRSEKQPMTNDPKGSTSREMFFGLFALSLSILLLIIGVGGENWLVASIAALMVLGSLDELRRARTARRKRP